MYVNTIRRKQTNNKKNNDNNLQHNFIHSHGQLSHFRPNLSFNERLL